MSSASTSIDPTDAENRDLIAHIQARRALPDKNRFLLFEDKREVELVWNGRTRDVCTTVLPFRTLEHVDEPRAEAAATLRRLCHASSNTQRPSSPFPKPGNTIIPRHSPTVSMHPGRSRPIRRRLLLVESGGRTSSCR